MVRPWLLLNPVLEDPLDILICCYRPNRVHREPTPALCGHNYLVTAAQTNWANEMIALDQWRGGSFDPEARQVEPRAHPGPANKASELKAGDDSDPLCVDLSSAFLDVPGAGDRWEGTVGMWSSTGGERRESTAKRMPLTLKLASHFNIED